MHTKFTISIHFDNTSVSVLFFGKFIEMVCFHHTDTIKYDVKLYTSISSLDIQSVTSTCTHTHSYLLNFDLLDVVITVDINFWNEKCFQLDKFSKNKICIMIHENKDSILSDNDIFCTKVDCYRQGLLLLVNNCCCCSHLFTFKMHFGWEVWHAVFLCWLLLCLGVETILYIVK